MRQTRAALDTRVSTYLFDIIPKEGTYTEPPSNLAFRAVGIIGRLLKYSECNDKGKESMLKYGFFIRNLNVTEEYLDKLFEQASPTILADAGFQMPPPTTAKWFVLRCLEHFDRLNKGLESEEPSRV